MDSASENAVQTSPSQWYVTDLSLSLQFHHHGLVIVSVIVFSFIVLVIILFCHFIRQYRHVSTGNRNHQVRVGGVAIAEVPTQNKGLDEATINSLPTFLHTSLTCSSPGGGRGVEGGGGASLVREVSECPICLGLFEENERMKVIPKCMHVYHLECLDKWLQSHANCPLCRSTIDTSTTAHDQLPA